MIAKISVGRGLRGALEYDFSDSEEGEPRARWVAGTLEGTPRQMSNQARAFRALRPEVKNPIWRCSLSLPPGERLLSEADWQSIADDFLVGMGIDTEKSAWCAVRHSDRDHDHIHISVVRIQADGKLWDRAKDVPRAIAVTKRLEEKHKLLTHPRPGDSPAPAHHPGHPQTTNTNLKGKRMREILRIRAAVDNALATQPAGIHFEVLQSLLREQGIELKASYTKVSKLRGFSYKVDGNPPINGGAVGREYSLGLIERGVVMPIAVPTPAFRTAKVESALDVLLREGQAATQPTPAHAPRTVPAPTALQGWGKGADLLSRHAPNLAVAGIAIAGIAAAAAVLSVAAMSSLLSFLKRALNSVSYQMTSNEGQIEPLPGTTPSEQQTQKASLILTQTFESVQVGDASLLPFAAGAQQQRQELASALVVAKVDKELGLKQGEAAQLDSIKNSPSELNKLAPRLLELAEKVEALAGPRMTDFELGHAKKSVGRLEHQHKVGTVGSDNTTGECLNFILTGRRVAARAEGERVVQIWNTNSNSNAAADVHQRGGPAAATDKGEKHEH